VRLRAAPLALALALAGCDCGGAPDPVLWVGLRDTPEVAEFGAGGGPAGRVASPPAIDTPVRALLVRRDGAVVALQEPERCAAGTLDPAAEACLPDGGAPTAVAPAVLLSRLGQRLLAFAGEDGGGAPLFTASTPPWAAAEDATGRIWVTGRPAPVVYGRSGALALDPAPLAYATRGVAPLPDGRVVVSYGVQALAVYDADGAVVSRIEPALTAEYEGIDGLAAEPGGTLLLATRRFGVTSSGVVVRARLEAGALVLLDPDRSAALGGGVPSALSLAGGRVLAAPPLGRFAAPACARWIPTDLARDDGCAVPGLHRGAVWLD
jgi:hypothetical protein